MGFEISARGGGIGRPPSTDTSTHIHTSVHIHTPKYAPVRQPVPLQVAEARDDLRKVAPRLRLRQARGAGGDRLFVGMGRGGWLVWVSMDMYA